MELGVTPLALWGSAQVLMVLTSSSMVMARRANIFLHATSMRAHSSVTSFYERHAPPALAGLLSCSVSPAVSTDPMRMCLRYPRATESVLRFPESHATTRGSVEPRPRSRALTSISALSSAIYPFILSPRRYCPPRTSPRHPLSAATHLCDAQILDPGLFVERSISAKRKERLLSSNLCIFLIFPQNDIFLYPNQKHKPRKRTKEL